MAKCKTITQDNEEKTVSGSNIQYEFVLESQVEVNLNLKFFSLYSS
jgi:hypothetical protein